MLENLVNQTRLRMDKAYDFLMDELKALRTGRATTAMVEDLSIEVYGQKMPLKSLASVSTPDAKTIVINPWDQNNTEAIERAIRENKNLDLNPLSDGKVIHINVPPLTEERRQAMVGVMREKVEQCNIALRNIRHEVLNEVKRKVKTKEASEDEEHRIEKALNDLMDEYKQKIEESAEAKQAEIMQV